ncbi:hypothetical protein [Streptomyces sporangiiformans]|uniref:Uncharacterized protein n=1 Tax=Streptomyces sporangiiformans TaxID=2315329 RepID=A0A505DJX5_9ACTN|nr:hypothetical protein [Streptomyces sporangiiformans]TPQ22725.1 hypothetical protein FGD71_007785 [Streptomyces sporangiiformans]
MEKYSFPSLGVAGALLFGLLTMEYDQFYRELGMAPGDVGLEYSTRLSGSAGLVLMSAVASATLFLLVAGVLKAARCFGASWVRDRAERVWSFLWRRERRGLTFIVCCTLSVLLVGALVTYVADEMADRAKSGRWVEPLHVGPITVLSVRAYPADVRLAVKDSGKQLNLETVNSSQLLYIGHGPDSVVLYDHERQRPLYLPAKDVTVTTYNCETWRAQRHSRCDG